MSRSPRRARPEPAASPSFTPHPGRLSRLAGAIAASRARRHLLFLAATVVTVLFVGYHFGTFDQTIHIPFLKKYVDPGLFPGDPFLELRFQHYSYFWFLFQPFYRAGLLEITLFVGHCAATYGTFWALYGLSRVLFQSDLAALLTVAGFVFPHVGFAGFPVIEFSLLNRTAVLPFLLLAMYLYLQRRIVPAYLLVGVMYNFHVISAQFVVAMFLFDGVLHLRRVGPGRLALGVMVFVLAALPVLIWKLGGSSVDLTPRPDWFDVIARGNLYNLFYLLPPYPHILLITASGLSALGLFVIARRALPAAPGHQTVLAFVGAALLILVVQVITAQWLPITIIVQSQIIRAGLFVLIFGYLYFAAYLADLYTRAAWPPLEWGALALAYVGVVLPMAPLFVWLVVRLVRAPLWRRVTLGVTLAASFAAMFGVAFFYDIWEPGVHLAGPRTDWEAAQVWARANTPRDALFITPPQIWWLYQSDWRVFSERSTVATLSELLEAAFAPEYLDYWRPRFEALAPGALDQFRGDYFENKRLTAAAFYGLTTTDFERLAAQYGAEYLVVEKPHAYDLPVAYQNAGYAIYALP
ncbi:MAG: hypothetical protein IT317_05985 [Anaerolineales bacterium]|nr:hypothetical protein [Anaerolineales bacterium]